MIPRKKSPRAPSMALGDAIEKANKIYDKERCHAAPADGVANHIGYKNAESGPALSAIASLKYYGLLERPREGLLAVSKDVEAYRFAPNENIKQALIAKWLKSPPLFAELLDKYTETLPSDATLKFELIQKGFTPAAADVCLQVFLRSVEFARHFDLLEAEQNDQQTNCTGESENHFSEPAPFSEPPLQPIKSLPLSQPIISAIANDDVDRIPVRLAGGRRAWIEIPMPFYEADKERLKKQIDLLITDDEEDVDDTI